MEAAKHTATPWQLSDWVGDINSADDELIASAYSMDDGGEDEKAANASFIVKACNSHAQLVAALEACYAALHPNSAEGQAARDALAAADAA